MYQDIMNRPMFQTPQQRQGAGIMAGVAPTTPIRGYADGDLVEDDDSMIASLLSQAEELPEAFSNLTMEDAVGYVKENPEILLAAIPGLGIGGVALRFGPGAARSAISLGKRLLTKKKAPKATEADIMGNVPARKAPKGLSAEQQAEGIMGLPTKAAGSAVSKLDKAKAVGKQVGSGISKVIRNPIKSTVAGTGIYALAQQFPDLELDKLMDQPEVRALYETLPEGLRDIISPDVGERVKFTDPAAKRLDEAKKAKAAGFPEEKPVVQQGPPLPPKTPSMYERAKGFLQDPGNQYAFAKAAAPSEGATPRNFASDFVLGKEEYKTIEAARDDETALEQNLKLLRREKPEASVDELLNLLLSKDTASEMSQRIQTETLSLFGKLRAEEININASDAELLNRAKNIVYGEVMPGYGIAPASTAGQTIDLEVSE